MLISASTLFRAAAALLIAVGLTVVQPARVSAEDGAAAQSRIESCAAVTPAVSNLDLLQSLEMYATGEAPYVLAQGCPPGYRNSLGYCIPLNATSCGGGRYCNNGGHCCGTGCCDMQSTCVIQNGVYGCRRL